MVVINTMQQIVLLRYRGSKITGLLYIATLSYTDEIVRYGKTKNPKISCYNLFTFTLFCTFIYLLTYLYHISSLQVTVKGLTTPLSRWVQVFVCVGARDSCVASYWIDTLVLKN